MRIRSFAWLHHGEWGPLPPGRLRKNLLAELLLGRPFSKFAILFVAFSATVLSLLGFYLQKHFVDSLVSAENSSTNPLGWIAGAFVALFGSHLLMVCCRALCQRESNLAQRKLAMVLYEKTLCLDPMARQSKTTGQLVSLFAQDVAATVAILDDTMPNLVAAVFPILIAPLAVGYFVDVSLWLPFTATALTILVCLFLSKRQGRFFSQTKIDAENRLSVVNEWLQNMRALRILGWTEAAEHKIRGTRVAETNNRLRMVTNGSTMNSIAQVAPYVVNLAGVLSFLWLSRSAPSPGDVFSLLWVFGVFLARPIRMFPWTLVIAKDASTSALRLQNFFALPELSTRVGGDSVPMPEGIHRDGKNSEDLLAGRDESHQSGAQEGAQNSEKAAEQNAEHQPFVKSEQEPEQIAMGKPSAPHSLPWALEIWDMRIRLGRDFSLEVPEFRIRKGSRTALVGPVGSGKSLFLAALLGEIPSSAQQFLFEGVSVPKMLRKEYLRSLAFVPQESFLMSATLAENVTLEYGSLDRTLPSLLACEFDPSREGLESGLQTMLGERGVNLSGGQRQRLSMARAHAADRSLIFLDDCFSALDLHTEQILIRNLLLKEWWDRTVVLATHRMTLLEHCDEIAFFHLGKVQILGNLAAALKASAPFRDFFEREQKLEESA